MKGAAARPSGLARQREKALDDDGVAAVGKKIESGEPPR